MTDASEVFEQDQNEALMVHIAEFGIRAYAALTVFSVLPDFENYRPAIEALMNAAPDYVALQGATLAISATVKQAQQRGE